MKLDIRLEDGELPPRGGRVPARNDVLDEEVAKVYGSGEAWFENKETNHRIENKGTGPATFIAVDIFKP